MGSEQQNMSLKTTSKMIPESCINPFCFFCTMDEPDPSLRKAKITQCFKEMPQRDNHEEVLVLSGLWNIAMTQPDDPEFPSLGIFECMAKLINKGINDKAWLVQDQNIYIPYYAAHIVGSYSMNKVEFAEKAVKSGVILPLIELLRGKITWIEQRVAVRALGHLASHESTFDSLSKYEVEIVELSMEIACNCLGKIYKSLVGVKDSERLKYHCDLLTRGLGGVEMENKKAEEWAGQLQSWSLCLLNCFARKKRSLNVICKKHFLKDLCEMWGGSRNPTSVGGIDLLRTLCDTKFGRERIASLGEVIESLGNLSRSSSDLQHMAIDCLVLLLKDMDTRYKVLHIAAFFLVDLVELKRTDEGREVIGETVTLALLQDYHKIKYGDMNLKCPEAERALKETWDLKVERRKRESLLSEEELEDRKKTVKILKQEGNSKFWSGQVEKAVTKYTKALDLCPLKMRRERIVLYSNRAQSYLVLKEVEAAISDATRALCLSSAARPHRNSLWRRAQAYDMKGLAKESLMDCLMFINGRMKPNHRRTKNVGKIPAYAARLIHRQMKATWLFADAAKSKQKRRGKIGRFDEDRERMVITIQEKLSVPGMPTILEEESLIGSQWKRLKQHKVKRKRDEAAGLVSGLARIKL